MNKLTPIALALALVLTPANAIPRDKRLHFQASTAIAILTPIAVENSFWKTMALCGSVGIAKELYDEYDYGGFDTEDLKYDALGCLTGYGLHQIIRLKEIDNLMLTSKKGYIGLQYSKKF